MHEATPAGTIAPRIQWKPIVQAECDYFAMQSGVEDVIFCTVAEGWNAGH
jgi:hypothetical protein